MTRRPATFLPELKVQQQRRDENEVNAYVPFKRSMLKGGPSEYVNTLIGTGGNGFGVGGDPPGPQVRCEN